MGIYDFIGRFKLTQGTRDIQLADGQVLRDFVTEGDQLFIGTGTHNDHILQSDGTVGVTVWQDGQQKFPANDGTASFKIDGGRLSFDGRFAGQPLKFLISLYRASVTGGVYRALYGVITWGDPDQVGAWGAEDDVDEEEGGSGPVETSPAG